jgi:hypothetical protein
MTNPTIIPMVLLTGSLLFVLFNIHIFAKRRKLQELNHQVEFAIKFADSIPSENHEPSTFFEILLFQDLKQQSQIVGTINQQGHIIRLTTSNDFIYEFYTGKQLELLILTLFKHHTEHPNEPLHWPLDNIECSTIVPFDMNN